jgi:hypothetical protein
MPNPPKLKIQATLPFFKQFVDIAQICSPFYSYERSREKKALLNSLKLNEKQLTEVNDLRKQCLNEAI